MQKIILIALTTIWYLLSGYGLYLVFPFAPIPWYSLSGFIIIALIVELLYQKTYPAHATYHEAIIFGALLGILWSTPVTVFLFPLLNLSPAVFAAIILYAVVATVIASVIITLLKSKFYYFQKEW